jgi:spermidine synthase
MRARFELFLVSILVLFLELACIRWFPAHVLFLTFFTNVMLLASFLGISVGCLAANRQRHYLTATPFFLALGLALAHGIEWERQRSGSAVDVGNHLSPQLVFFGVESQPWDPSRFVIPIEAVCGVLFVIVALTLVGPGQQLGRALARVPNRVEAYTLNIAGSIAGILVFMACSSWQLGPTWWFGPVLILIAYFLMPHDRLRAVMLVAVPVTVVLLLLPPATGAHQREFWSPYYRVQYIPEGRFITVNLIGHQQMVGRDSFSPAYALPHLLNRDSGQDPFAQVLVIGAGSGNDVSRALQWGASRVDAVEIDPVIYSLGKRDHPDSPYADRRVFVHLDDGRNFLRSTNKQYDLIVYALVDSLVLHSGYSNIRLESYLFTTEAFADIRQRLKPGGLFVMYNYFRQGWIVARLNAMLENTFGPGNPVVFNLPARSEVRAEDVMFDEFTLMFAGDTGPLKQRFAVASDYLIRNDQPTNPSAPNGFEVSRSATPETGWMAFRPSVMVPSQEPIANATDSWPFLYLRRPMIPALSWRGIVMMGVLGALFMVPFARRTAAAAPMTAEGRSGVDVLAHMFFLGAGFMLIETKAVVHMALLFGSTWTVNAIVFCAVLSMILLANLFVLVVQPQSPLRYYAGLFIALAANALVPMDAFLGLTPGWRVFGSCLITFTPVFFAGVIFATSFRESRDPDRAFGANIAGAMLGGLTEYSSMLIGFQYVTLVAMVFYGLSALGRSRRPSPTDATVGAGL